MTTEGGFRAASAVLLAGLMLLAGVVTSVSAQEGTGTVRLRVESHGTPLRPSARGAPR
jgi:hypothetical protein